VTNKDAESLKATFLEVSDFINSE